MKKLSIFFASLLAFGLVACDDKSDLGIQQINEQGAVLEADGVSVTRTGFGDVTSFNLNGQEGNVLDVLSYQAKTELPAGSTVQFVMELSGQNGANLQEYTLTPGDVYTIPVNTISGWYQSTFGNDPRAQVVNVKVKGYLVNGTELIRLGDNNTYFINENVTITPVDLGFDIENSYYIIDSKTGMAVDKAILLAHSEKHPYDDPKFMSNKISVTKADIANGPVTWMIVPGSVYESAGSLDKCFGGLDNADLAALSGSLALGGKPLELAEPADYQITIDMIEKTYTVGFAAEQLYVWTNRTQWNTEMRLLTSDYVSYNGVAYIAGSWEFTSEKSFEGMQIGRGTTEGTMKYGAKALPFSAPKESGLFYITANLAEMTYTTTPITLGVVGTCNNWGNETDGVVEPDIAMTSANSLNNVYTATVTFPAAGQFKVRANGTWDINWGPNGNAPVNGTYELMFGGQDNNVNVEAGTYEISINFATVPYTLNVVKKK